MPSRLLVAAALLAAFAASDAAARIVYKCTTAHGDIAFQDKPCAKGQHETAIDVGEPPPPPPAVAPPVAAVPAPAPPPPEPPPPRKPLPALWMCVRAEDGSSYISQNGSPPSRLVPAGILGYPPKSLAEVYGPGANKAPTAGGRNTIAGDYVEVRDACAPASADQTCTYLRGELDAVDKKLRNAFKDDRAKLEPRQQELRDELDGC